MTLKLSHNSHYRFGFNCCCFRERKSDNETFFLGWGRVSKSILGFKEECIRASKLIRDEHQGELAVFLSGGIDSEVVLRSFHESKIPVTAYILTFRDNLNIHDVSWGIVVCQQLGINYKLVDIDILKFLKSSELFQYAYDYYSASLEEIARMWLLDQVDGVPVMGNGDPSLVYEGATGWHVMEGEKWTSSHIKMAKDGRSGAPGFFHYTPELFYSFCSSGEVSFVVRDSSSYKEKHTNTHEIKKLKFQRDFNCLDRKKYTGFEIIDQENPWINELRTELRGLYPANAMVYVPYKTWIENSIRRSSIYEGKQQCHSLRKHR